VWSDIAAVEWDKNIYFEKLQTIDNLAVLNEIVKKDWFRWDWLVKHDIYAVLDLLFSIVKDAETAQKTLQYSSPKSSQKTLHKSFQNDTQNESDNVSQRVL
jgi:hypothetical protein